jgi:hypothetical protein
MKYFWLLENVFIIYHYKQYWFDFVLQMQKVAENLQAYFITVEAA